MHKGNVKYKKKAMDIDKELKDKTKTINNCCNEEIEEPDHDNEWENLIEDLEDLISDSE